MGFRKFTADLLFTGKELLGEGYVLITNPEGVILDIVDKKNAGGDVEEFKGLLTPGFINAHCHLELSHLKGVVPGGTGLVEFVQQVMTKRTGAPEEKIAAMQNAEQELYNSGTVAVGDICNTADSIPNKLKSKLHWHNFIEVSGFVDAVAEKRLGEAKDIFKEFKAAGFHSELSSLSPHAPYSVSKSLFQYLNKETAGQLISIHNQESLAEDELYKDKSGGFLSLYKNFGIDISNFQPTGKSSLQSWLAYFTNGQKMILVHDTFTTQADLDHIRSESRQQELNFCICINANKYIEQTIPPIDLLRKNNCTIIIGTDSYASNWQLNMLEEIKTIQQETAFSIPLEEILTWATINGAKALQFADVLGSFEKSKKPGVVLIDQMNGRNISIHSTAKRII